jgi:uroporphyrin-III C-methyltransferase
MNKACVYLVGAGPGDPELLTIKAVRLISSADVVVHDGLVDDAIMALINPAARLISVAKSRSRHSVPQDGINDILIREAVPGISAAMGGAAATMLPLTHRDAASAVTFVAGQCKGLTDQNWAGLAGKDRTLVIYMGIATAVDITEKLISDGLSPDTPVAVLERATRPDARAMRTILTDLGDMIAREGVVSPAIIIVGDVVLKSDAEDRLFHFAKQAEKIA